MSDVSGMRWLAGALCSTLIGCSSGGSSSGGTGGAGGSSSGGAGGAAGGPAYSSEIYSQPEHWLCLPGAPDNRCLVNLDATRLEKDGTETIEPHVAAASPAVDCFYVYPTISADPTPNSDLVPGDEETLVLQNQAARLTSICELYAPVYRQRTLAALLGNISEPADAELAYGDVVDAFQHYLAQHGDGRGFILVGHSQGSSVLRRLIQEEIDDVPDLRARLISAFLLGSTVAVPENDDVGGAFDNVPLCRERSETGCFVSYATYLDTEPPPADSRYGGSPGPGLVAACNNPAGLSGGRVPLTPYFQNDAAFFEGRNFDTPYVTSPDWLQGECVRRNGFSYFELTVDTDPADALPDDVGGRLTPAWGLHLIDSNITMGDVVDLAEDQANAYLGR